MKKKLKNFLIVTSIGDQFGVPFEHHWDRSKQIIIPHPKHDYSDDTVCTFGIAKALIENLDLSRTLRKVCRQEVERGYGKSFLDWVYDDKMGPYGSWGNGASMRVSSVALLAKSELECLNLAEKTAEITHNHPEGIKGAKAIALAIYLCLNGADKNTIKERVLDHFYPDYPKKSYQEIKANSTFDVSCQGSVPPVLYAFLESESYIDGLKKVYEYKADTDSQGAMISPILYAYYEEVPEDLLKMAKSKLPKWMLDVNDQFNFLMT